MNEQLNQELSEMLNRIKPQSDEEFDQREKRNRDCVSTMVYNDLIAKSEISQRHLKSEPIKDGPWWEKCRYVLDSIDSRTGKTIALVSQKRGSGKTQIGCEAIKHACAKGRSCLFTSALNVLMQVRASYNGGPCSELEVMANHIKPSLLVIDELGRCKQNDFSDGTFFHILNSRYNAIKDTILISNQSAAEFTNSIGVSLASRMHETGGIIECEWESFRK